MQSDWLVFPLGDLVINHDARRVPVRELDRVPGPYPYYGASGVVDHVAEYIFDGEYLLVAEDGENLKSRKLPIAFLAGGKFWVNNHAHILQGNEKASTRFLHYALQSAHIESFLSGSTMPKLTQGNLNRIPILTPPINEQEAIVESLGVLDRRIEGLEAQNRSLERLSRAIFKSWFVDFDPVRAKAEGREPAGMDATTAALFPKEMVASANGEIPKGWRYGDLSGVCRRRGETANIRSLAENEPYVGLEHIPRRSWQLSAWGSASEVTSTKARFSKDDVLFGKLRPYFHKVVVAPMDGVCSTDILVIRPSDDFARSFALGHLSSDQLIAYTTRLSNGARMPRTSWQDVASYQVCIPTVDVLKSFDHVIWPMVEKIKQAVFQMQTLTELRDTLLPRLISGKLRVPEAEKLVASAL